jgi:hypothetical protein
MSTRLALPALVAVSFVAGFGVAELTGVRALGGLVLVAGGLWCTRLALRLTGATQTVVLIAIGLALFVLAHPLGHAIGAWPAVLVSAALAASMAGAVTRIWPNDPEPLR